MTVNEYSVMIGHTMSSVVGSVGDHEAGGDELTFTSTSGDVFRFYHSQDCCESVYIEDICGDLNDLVGSPIIEAEEVSSESEEPKDYEYRDDSHTWTFYRFSTAKGSVTVRWLGESNGYYSEGVSFYHKKPRS